MMKSEIKELKNGKNDKRTIPLLRDTEPTIGFARSSLKESAWLSINVCNPSTVRIKAARKDIGISFQTVFLFTFKG